MKKTVKIVVSGDGGVGKTSFLNRLVNNNFEDDSELTKGVDFYSKDFKVNGTEYNFVMWDFAGQPQFTDLLEDFVDGSIAAVILFDLTRFNTLENVQEWMKKLKDFGNIPIILLGSKSDLINPYDCFLLDSYISEIIKLNENVIDYIKISSKTGININRAFEVLIESITCKNILF